MDDGCEEAVADQEVTTKAVGMLEGPMDPAVSEVAVGPVADEERSREGSTRREGLDRRQVPTNDVGAEDIRQVHARDEVVVTEDFRRAVVFAETVMFPFDVSELGIDVATNAIVTAEVGGEVAERLADVAVAHVSRDAAVFAVEEGFVALAVLHRIRGS